MKKLFGRCFNVILILALTFALGPALPAMAEEDVSAFIMEGGTITGYTGPGGDVVLPASATAVADYAFAGNAAISSVTIPANVTSVGSYAFSGRADKCSIWRAGKPWRRRILWLFCPWVCRPAGRAVCYWGRNL